MNRSFLLYLWMRNRILSIILVLANIASIAVIIWDPWNFLLIIGLMIVPLITIGLGAGATRSIWNMRYEWLCRFCNHVGHFAPVYGKPTDGEMQAVQYFIRMYPWASRSRIEYKMVPDGKDHSILSVKFSGNGLQWELLASQATQTLTRTELLNLMKMSP